MSLSSASHRTAAHHSSMDFNRKREKGPSSVSPVSSVSRSSLFIFLSFFLFLLPRPVGYSPVISTRLHVAFGLF
ncbi:hypothetical protein LZ31DRAFT_308960 [Colletotrichum somersetense]|nr:hypothetical protein LZ31DRAFT_308960 [Colletotrichum somersetense]